MTASQPSTSPTPPPQAAPSRAITLRVEGMSCGGCVKAVTEGAQNAGATDVDVHLKTAMATMQYAGDVETLLQAIKSRSSKTATVVSNTDASSLPTAPSPADITLHVKGMTCGSCVKAVTEGAHNAGATDVHVQLTTGLATMNYSGDMHKLIQAIKSRSSKTAIVVPNYSTPPASTLSPLPTSTTTPANVSTLHNPAQSCPVPLSSNPPSTTTSQQQQQQQHTIVPSSTSDKEATTSPPDNANTTQLRVTGMTCSSCVGMVERTLNQVPGVLQSKVNLLMSRATVIHDASHVSPETLVDIVTDSGYKSLLLDTFNPNDKEATAKRTTSFRINFQTEMQAFNAQKALRFMSGVAVASATYCTVAATLHHGCSKASVIRALEADGSFEKLVLQPSEEAELEAIRRGERDGASDVINEEAAMWRRRFTLAAVFFVPILITSILANVGVIPMRPLRWIHMILATPVQFISGKGFYKGSYHALKNKRATMDVLIATSSSIAYFSSLIVVLFGLERSGDMSLGHAPMFKVASMIIFMVLIGKWVEAHAKKQAAKGVAALSSLAPDTATLFDEATEMVCHSSVPVGMLDIGDVVKIIPGDRIPVDGDVIDGMSAVDESMLSGESIPVPKSTGDSVYGGTVNGGGQMYVRTTAVGSEAVLAQIVTLVHNAQTSRAPVEAYADRISAVFVPVVVGLSVLIFIGWYVGAIMGLVPSEWYASEGKFFFSLLFALETMVIACPCALGLATPTAVMVASSVGTRLGVLFRGGGHAIETAKDIQNVLFDKTGTLTEGRPEVAAVIYGEQGCRNTERARVIVSDLVRVVESSSHHPLASALTRYIDQQQACDTPQVHMAYKLSSVKETPGMGIEAVVNRGEYKVKVGSFAFVFADIAAEKLLSESELQSMRQMSQEDGLTIVVGMVNEELVVIYGLEDTIRAEAADVVQELHRMGIQTHMVTGDSWDSARAVAARVGVPSACVKAQALPWVKTEMARHTLKSCFVGDGINDAPALAGASVGIAIGAGAPVAAESASVVLVRADLRGVIDAIDLARETFRRVRINFMWAIVYNIIGIPIAAGVLYPWLRVRVPPMVASGAMALSSSCVVVSSLALRWYKPRLVKVSHSDLGIEMKRIGGASSPSGNFTIDDDDEQGSFGSSTSGPIEAPLLTSRYREEMV